MIRERAGGGHRHGDQPGGGAGFPLGLAQFEEQRVALRRCPLREFAEPLPVFFERAPAHGAFLVHARGAFGKDVNLAVLGHTLDPQLAAHCHPRTVGQRRFQPLKPRLWRADQIMQRRIAGAHPGQCVLRRDTAIHDPDPTDLPVTLFHQRDHRRQRGLVGGVARHHLVSERQALGRDHQGDDHLHTVAAPVARVTKLARIVFRLGPVAFKIGARQVVEQNVVAGRKEIRPPFAQMRKQRFLVLEQPVMAAVERGRLRHARIDLQQVGQRGGGEPMPVHPPL